MGSPSPLLPKHANGNMNGHSRTRTQSLHHTHHKRTQSLAAAPGSSTTQSTLRSFFCGSRRVVVFVCLSLTGVLLLLSFWTPSGPKIVQSPLPATGDATGSRSVSALEVEEVDVTGWRRPLKGAVDWLGGRLGSERRPQSYREHLEATTSPPFFNSHSPTLTFSHIYVLSLPTRQDRRARMEKLGRALGLKFTFIDALTKDQGVIRWIGERVEEIRKRKAPIVAKAQGKTVKQVGGMRPGSDWLTRSDGEGNLSATFPSLREKRWGNRDWVQYLLDEGPTGLDAAEEEGFDVAARLHDRLDRTQQRQLSEGAIAVWYGQTSVMREILRNGDESALVLEDDVDFEWDLERLWASVHRRLPKAGLESADGWKITFLGHCWGRESTRPQYNHPLLHQSSEPRCLHGYALTAAGAKRILHLLADPWIAYQTAVDIAIPTFISEGLLGPNGAFSIDPQIIVQSKELSSDISKGTGSPWRGVLMDSTWDRVLRDEGFDVLEPIFVEGADPATRYRIRPPEPDAIGGLTDPEEIQQAAADAAAAKWKVEQDQARKEALNREVLVEGINAPKKVPSKKLPAPAVGKDGKKAAEVVVDPSLGEPGMVHVPIAGADGRTRKKIMGIAHGGQGKHVER